MKKNEVDMESTAVQSYLTILQGVIGRMASNSASVKTWCIALVSAIVVVIADHNEPGYLWITLIPISLFFALDAYYLGLERCFREQYNEFIRKLHDGTAVVDDLFIVTPKGGQWRIVTDIVGASRSVSIWPFYVFLGGMLVVMRFWVLSGGAH